MVVRCFLNTFTWQNVVALKHVWPVKCWTLLGAPVLPKYSSREACPPRGPRVSVALDTPPPQAPRPHLRLCLCLAGLRLPTQTLTRTAAAVTHSRGLSWLVKMSRVTAFKIWSEGLQNSLPPNGLRSESQVTNLELQIHFPGHPLSPAKSLLCCSLHASGNGELTSSQEILPSWHSRSSKRVPLLF